MTEIKIDGRTFIVTQNKTQYSHAVILTIEDRGDVYRQYFNAEDYKVLVDFLSSFSKHKISLDKSIE